MKQLEQDANPSSDKSEMGFEVAAGTVVEALKDNRLLFGRLEQGMDMWVMNVHGIIWFEPVYVDKARSSTHVLR